MRHTRPAGATLITAMVTRCPFSVLGLDSDQMAACPGFDGEVVNFTALGQGQAVRGLSCLHLGSEHSGRGFVGACHHPDSDVVLPVAYALCREDAARSRPQVVVDPALDMPERRQRDEAPFRAG
jgi:hypothetical protein